MNSECVRGKEGVGARAHLVRDVIICIVAGQLLRVFWAVRVRKMHNIIVIDKPMVVVDLHKSAQDGK